MTFETLVGPFLVVAPHPDDEVLGVGGTTARLADEGKDVVVTIVTRGGPPLFESSLAERTRAEAARALEVLGGRGPIFLDGFPAALVDTVPHSELNAALGRVIEDVDPEVLFVPFYGDLHLDHRLVFESTLVASRPREGRRLRAVYAYEVMSETNWNAPSITPSFAPNVFVDIAPYLDRKLAAMKAYETQVKPFPHERSLEALRALAELRGATVGFRAAEAFMLIRATEPVTRDA